MGSNCLLPNTGKKNDVASQCLPHFDYQVEVSVRDKRVSALHDGKFAVCRGQGPKVIDAEAPTSCQMILVAPFLQGQSGL